MTDGLRERMRRLIDDAPDWSVPLFVDMLKRFRDGVPTAEVERLFRQELAAIKEAPPT